MHVDTKNARVVRFGPYLTLNSAVLGLGSIFPGTTDVDRVTVVTSEHKFWGNRFGTGLECVMDDQWLALLKIFR
jgi:hypothetical protein